MTLHLYAVNPVNFGYTYILQVNPRFAIGGSLHIIYVIPGKRNSGVICLNGAAARCVQPGDVVIIMAYAEFTEEEASRHEPIVVMADEKNSIKEIRGKESHGEM